jgi:hypothetical protein
VEAGGDNMKPIILLLSLLLASCAAKTKPDIYITRTDSYRTIDGNIIWVLEYTVNGAVQNPGFNSQEAMTRFREYLDTIGNVYQREEEE